MFNARRFIQTERRYAIVFLFIFFCLTLKAQQTDTIRASPSTENTIQNAVANKDSVQTYYRVNGQYLKTYWFDLKHVVSRPFHWQGKDWAKFAVIGGTAGLLFTTADKPLREMMLRNQKEFFSSVAEAAYPLGNRFPPLLLSGMYLTGVITKSRKLEHSSLSIAKSLAISTIIYTTTKSLIRRQRPTRTDDPYLFAPPFSKKGYTSFPSGHANTAFSVATGFAMEYKDSKWVPWVAYSLATLTSVSRMYQDRHWSSDVLIGAVIGHFVTKTIYRLEDKRHRLKSNTISLR